VPGVATLRRVAILYTLDTLGGDRRWTGENLPKLYSLETLVTPETPGAPDTLRTLGSPDRGWQWRAGRWGLT